MRTRGEIVRACPHPGCTRLPVRLETMARPAAVAAARTNDKGPLSGPSAFACMGASQADPLHPATLPPLDLDRDARPFRSTDVWRDDRRSRIRRQDSGLSHHTVRRIRPQAKPNPPRPRHAVRRNRDQSTPPPRETKRRPSMTSSHVSIRWKANQNPPMTPATPVRIGTHQGIGHPDFALDDYTHRSYPRKTKAEREPPRSAF